MDDETLDTLLSKYVQFVDGTLEDDRYSSFKDFAIPARFLCSDNESDDWIDALNLWYQCVFGRVCDKCDDERTFLWIYEAAKARMKGDSPPNEYPSAKCMMNLCAGHLEEGIYTNLNWSHIRRASPQS